MPNSSHEFLQQVIAQNPAEKEFHQAVREVVESIWPVMERDPRYRSGKILDRIVEPERIIIFRVPWTDDQGDVQVNRGFRIEMTGSRISPARRHRGPIFSFSAASPARRLPPTR